MELPRIIGICGRRRCGKDTLANYLMSEHGYTNRKIADDLKKIVKILFGFTDSQLETDEKDMVDASWGITPRKSMQFIGTEVMQFKIQDILPTIGRKFWIDAFIKKYVNLEDRIVISDLRFLHEYEELKKHNVFVIRIERPMHQGEPDEHASEKEYMEIPANMVLHNTGSVDELFALFREGINRTL
jgi:hypothetical protein